MEDLHQAKAKKRRIRKTKREIKKRGKREIKTKIIRKTMTYKNQIKTIKPIQRTKTRMMRMKIRSSK